MKRIAFLLLFFCLLSAVYAQHYTKSGRPDRRYKENRSSTYSSPTYKSSTTVHHSSYATGVQRDSHGRIKRSQSARHEFMKMTGYPHGRKGYVIQAANTGSQPAIDGHAIINNGIVAVVPNTSVTIEPPFTGANYFWVTPYNSLGYGVSSDALFYNAPAKIV